MFTPGYRIVGGGGSNNLIWVVVIIRDGGGVENGIKNTQFYRRMNGCNFIGCHEIKIEIFAN